MIHVDVKPELPRWVRKHAGMVVDGLADSFAKYGEWEQGDARPDFSNLRELRESPIWRSDVFSHGAAQRIISEPGFARHYLRLPTLPGLEYGTSKAMNRLLWLIRSTR